MKATPTGSGLLLFVCGIMGCSALPVRQPPPNSGTVKIAVVHFAPEEGNTAANRRRIVELTEEAARNDAKIIVHTEMAIPGYSFFSRDEISRVAEPIPGPSTDAVGDVARRHGVYVALGLAEVDPATHLYYNSVALIAPTGNVLGVYRKRNNLLEASYAAEVFAPVPTFDTPYGRIAIVICADMFYSQFARSAAVAGAQILLAPANVGITTDFIRVRTFENDFAMIVANRFGSGSKGGKPGFFNQDTFAIPSPFQYDFSNDSRSVIMTHDGRVLADLSTPKVAIGYGEVPIRFHRAFPVVRRPSLYSLIAQDTLEPYTFSQLGLPPPGTFAAAAVDPGSNALPWDAALTSPEHAADALGPDLYVFSNPPRTGRADPRFTTVGPLLGSRPGLCPAGVVAGQGHVCSGDRGRHGQDGSGRGRRERGYRFSGPQRPLA